MLTALLAAGLGTARADLLSSGELRASNPDSGVSWVTVKLTNQTNASQGATIVFYTNGGSSSGEVRVPVAAIPPGATRTLNIPLLFGMQSAYMLADDGTVRGFAFDTFARGMSGNAREYLLVSPPEMQLTEAQLDDFTRANTVSYPGIPLAGGGVMYSTRATASSTGVTTAPLLAGERSVTQMDVAELPENWLCYLPLKILFMSEVQEREITPAQRTALDTWVSLGGSVYFFDSQSSETMQQGRGSVTRLKENPVLAKTNFSHVPNQVDPFMSSLSLSDMPYVEEDKQGRGFSLLLITLFVIGVGPVNYVYFARRGDIRKLLKTVPAISLGFCGLIAGYFLVTEGFARKGGSISVTRLDESSNRAVTFAQHFLLSGLYPSGGFHFARETYLRPLFGQWRRDEGVRANLGNELVITRGLFRPKIPLQYMTIKPHISRERLLVADDAASVRNGFELPVRAVAVWRNGQYYAGGAAPSGGEIALQKAPPHTPPAGDTGLTKPEDERIMVRLVSLLAPAARSPEEIEFARQQTQAILLDETGPTSGTIYAVAFDGMPAGVEPGVDITDGKNFHVVVGTAQEGTAK